MPAFYPRLPASVIPAVTDHGDWAARPLWFFGIYAGVRLVVLWFDLKALPGTVGRFLDCTGTVLLRRLAATSLR